MRLHLKEATVSNLLSMWWRDGEFISHLEQWWKESNIFRGTPSYCFVKRLKFLKEKIKVWNKYTFKNIFAERDRVEEELSLLNYVTITFGMSNDAYHKEITLKKELAEILLREEIYWHDKSRELWIKEGDANTKFFHASVKTKRSGNRIDSILDQEGKRHSSPEAIEEVAVNFFKDLLGDVNGHKPPQPHLMMNIIYKEISDEDNKLLCCPFTIEEIKKVVFDLHPNKAPGPYRFTMDFFPKCWGFLGNDILRVMEDFRKQWRFVKEINHTNIALIPKKRDCSSIVDFRPIYLCNSIYKIASKAMVNRLKPILMKIISLEQHGFTPGREIMDSIIMAVETIHYMHTSKFKGMIIKLDVTKACDGVMWSFLIEVLRKFGFDKRWLKCIEHCISSINLSIIVNGSVSGFFQVTNGLRQGDSLSPFLFVLVAEVLDRHIKRKVGQGHWKGFSIHESLDPISH